MHDKMDMTMKERHAMQVDKNSKHANKNQKHFCDCLFMPFLEMFKIAFAFTGGRCRRYGRVIV